MKSNYFILIGLMVFLLAGCQQSTRHQHEETTEAASMSPTGSFGVEFDQSDAIPTGEVVSLFGETDTVEAILSGHIKASCKHSGCWMDLDLGEENKIHVTFKEDEFAIPLDAAGKDAVVKGVAVREMIPVETLRNYAREEGKSEEEIAAITEPAWEYEFVATGVIIEE